MKKRVYRKPFPVTNGACLIGDPVLGWRRRPGISLEEKESLRRKLEIGEHGFRVLPGQPEKFDKRVWVFGCSCTEGQWLEDEDTFCYLIQKRFPNWRIEPFAIGAYSTFQNLLQFEANLVLEKPDIVVFTYIPGHRLRNVADPYLWTPFMDRNVERFNHGLGLGPAAFRPAAKLDRKGNLVFKKAYPPKNRDVYDGMMANQPDNLYRDIVMTKILQHARELAENAGAELFFAILWSDESARNNGLGGSGHLDGDPLIQRLKNAGINIIDADPGLSWDETTFRPVDFHPNAKANFHFARKIGDALESVA